MHTMKGLFLSCSLTACGASSRALMWRSISVGGSLKSKEGQLTDSQIISRKISCFKGKKVGERNMNVSSRFPVLVPDGYRIVLS